MRCRNLPFGISSKEAGLRASVTLHRCLLRGGTELGDDIMMFILSLNFTDQGIRGIKEAPKRAQAARDLAKKVGVEIKQVYFDLWRF